jgi:hypothetical protein
VNSSVTLTWRSALSRWMSSGFHGVPRNDQDIIGQPALVEVFQHREGVRPNNRQERIGGAVEQLDRRRVQLEVLSATRLTARCRAASRQ